MSPPNFQNLGIRLSIQEKCLALKLSQAVTKDSFNFLVVLVPKKESNSEGKYSGDRPAQITRHKTSRYYIDPLQKPNASRQY
jgi:hypothetical protein